MRKNTDQAKLRVLMDSIYPRMNILLRTTYTDRRADGSKRIKVWRAGTFIRTSALEQQWQLEEGLQALFGARYQGGHFVKDEVCSNDRFSFAIVLKD